MRCGVAGISSIETPKGESASFTALRIAAGAPIAPPSPRPLAPVTEPAAGVSRCRNSSLVQQRHYYRELGGTLLRCPLYPQKRTSFGRSVAVTRRK